MNLTMQLAICILRYEMPLDTYTLPCYNYVCCNMMFTNYISMYIV